MKTIEQVNEEMLKLEEFVLNRVKFVPFGEIEYKFGYISKITLDKRTNTILMLIITEDGKKVYKTPNAKFLEILDEKVEGNVKISKDSLNAQLTKISEEYATLSKEYDKLQNEVNELREKLKKYIK